MAKPIVLSIDIDRDPDDVFDYTSDYRNEAEWQSNVLELTCEPPDGPVAVGTRIRKVRKTPMGRQTFTIEVTELDRSSRTHADRTVDGPFAGTTGRWRIEPAGQGARVEMVAEFAFDGVIQVLAPFVRRTAAKDLRRELESLKARLESPDN